VEYCLECGNRSIVDIGSSQAPKSLSAQRASSRDTSYFNQHTSKVDQQVSRGLRFAGAVLDFVIAGLTFGFGWLVWFLFVIKRGQTPAKFLLKTRLVQEWGSVPKLSVTFWRYYIPNLLSWMLAPFAFLGLLSLPQAFALIFGLLQLLAWLLPMIDSLLIFLPARKRGVDYLFKTKVVFL
jgi:uncharacterized RDD family membrane protein YckC